MTSRQKCGEPYLDDSFLCASSLSGRKRYGSTQLSGAVAKPRALSAPHVSMSRATTAQFSTDSRTIEQSMFLRKGRMTRLANRGTITRLRWRAATARPTSPFMYESRFMYSNAPDAAASASETERSRTLCFWRLSVVALLKEPVACSFALLFGMFERSSFLMVPPAPAPPAPPLS